jgi:hypothetical protein
MPNFTINRWYKPFRNGGLLLFFPHYSNPETSKPLLITLLPDHSDHIPKTYSTMGQFMVPSGVIKHGGPLGKPATKWAFTWENHP